MGSGNVTVLLNNGQGGFTVNQSFYAADNNSIAALAIGDVDGDGNLDLVTAFGTSNGIGVFSGNRDGTFAVTAQTYATGGAANFIALGDFNKDGKLDVVTTGTEMDVLLNTGSGLFGAYQKVGPAGSDILAVNVNGDGFPDLVQADASNASIDVLLNKADWTTGQRGTSNRARLESHLRLPTGPDFRGGPAVARCRSARGSRLRLIAAQTPSREETSHVAHVPFTQPPAVHLLCAPTGHTTPLAGGQPSGPRSRRWRIASSSARSWRTTTEITALARCGPTSRPPRAAIPSVSTASSRVRPSR